MKKLLIIGSLLFTFIGYAQPLQRTAPDCDFGFRFNVTNGTITSTTTLSNQRLPLSQGGGNVVGFDNREIQCATFSLGYFTEGVGAVSIEMDQAPSAQGIPGSWTVWPAAQIAAGGTLPLTSLNFGNITILSIRPWVSVNLNSATGTGQVYGRVVGWRAAAGQDVSSGSTQVQGLSPNGSAANGNPVLIAGINGGNTTTLAVDSSGRAILGTGTQIVGKVGIDQSTPDVTNNVTIQQNVTGSTLNSSTAQLNAGATFTGSCESTLSANALQINVVSDQQITVEVDQSPVANCSVIASAFTYVVPASNTASPFTNYSTEATNSFYRIKATNNGGVATTTFRVDTAVCPICNSGFASGASAGIAGEGLAAIGFPVQIGGKFETTPTVLTNGQQGTLQQDANQNLKVVIANTVGSTDPCQDASVLKSSTFANITTATTTAILASSGSTVIYICGYNLVMTGTVTADTILLEDGTGAACATTQVQKTPNYSSGILANGATAFTVGFAGQTVFSTASGGEICAVTGSVATTPTISLMITYVRQ